MKKLITLVAIILMHTTFALSQPIGKSDIKMRATEGSDNEEMLGLLRFEDIKLINTRFAGEGLKGKHFQIMVKEIVDGKITKSEVGFDSTESEDFRIKENKLSFYFFAKTTVANTTKFEFQFPNFRKALDFKIAATDKDFTAKTFLGMEDEISIPLNKETYILAYLMPFVRKDGSRSYCEVVQSDIKPEDLGTKFNIPRYYLFSIKFQ